MRKCRIIPDATVYFIEEDAKTGSDEYLWVDKRHVDDPCTCKFYVKNSNLGST